MKSLRIRMIGAAALIISFTLLLLESERLPFDAGITRSEPFFLMVSGQSNADGSSELPASSSSKPNPLNIEDGVFVWDFKRKEFKTPVVGTPPLGLSNNAGIQAANHLARRTGRDVYVFVNAWGGQSIAAWVEQGTESPFWSQHDRSVLQQLKNAEVDRLDHNNMAARRSRQR